MKGVELFTKPKKWRSKKYMEWVARRPSMLSGMIDRNVSHHHRVGTDGGTGMKPSDSYCIPLTYNEHDLFHAGRLFIDSEQAFKAMVRQLTEYLIEEEGEG